jgi:hypothetical protein
VLSLIEEVVTSIGSKVEDVRYSDMRMAEPKIIESVVPTFWFQRKEPMGREEISSRRQFVVEAGFARHDFGPVVS